METVEDEAAEPHPFLALVLARMKTNPEEFNPDNSPWRAMIDQSKQYLTTEEKTALKAAERDVGLDHMHKKLMKRLLADKTPTPSLTSSQPLSATTSSAYLGSAVASLNTHTTPRGQQRITRDGYHEVHDGYGWKRLKLEGGYV